MRELLDLPEHFIIQGASEGSNNSGITLLLEFILCVRCFVSIFVRLDSFPIQLLHQGSLMHCDVQVANQKARKLMLKLNPFLTEVLTCFDRVHSPKTFVGKR